MFWLLNVAYGLWEGARRSAVFVLTAFAVGIGPGVSPALAQTLSSGTNQVFTVGDIDRRANPITITDAVGTINIVTGIRIIIPTGLNLQWSDTVTTLDVSGSAAAKINTTPVYSANGDTLTITVTAVWTAGDQLVISNLVFTNFTATNGAQRLRLAAGVVTNEQDNRNIRIQAAIYGVSLSPHAAATSRLPSNGTNYAIAFTVTDTSNVTGPVSYDLLTSHRPGGVVTTSSITGTGVTQDANPDSARVTLSAGTAVVATVTYSVGNVAAGSIDTLVFLARAAASPATIDTGKLVVTVTRPSLTVVRSVNPGGTPPPGTDLTYTVTMTNTGTENAVNVVHVDSVPAEIGFKVGSVSTTLPGGLTGSVAYSNDGGTTWSYVPVSAGCGAPAGYDSCVRAIRLSLDNPLSNVGPNNIVQLVFVAQVK